MLTLSLAISFLFLIWACSLTTFTHSLTKLGETHSEEVIRPVKRRFFYLPLHRRVFPSASFELLIFASTLGENLGRIGYVACATLALYFWGSIGSVVWLLGLIAFLFLLLFFGDFLPRVWATRMPERALRSSLILASFFLILSLPLSFFFMKIAEIFYRVGTERGAGDPLEEMKETVVQILRSANVKGKLGVADKKLIESVIKFKDRIVREVMVPRVDLFSLDATRTVRDAAPQLVEEGYSRTPVYKETVDNVIGVLMFKDILQLYMDCLDGKRDPKLLETPIGSISKSVFYTPETKKVAQLLQEFRTKQMHMAIVVDEYGGTEGVVTMEDILEEIVGEIADEYDIDEEQLYTTQPGGGGWIVDAKMSILDAEETFNIHIPQEGEYDTIGGYLFHKVGSIPEEGQRLHHEDFDLEILSSSERSVDKVRITPRPRNRS